MRTRKFVNDKGKSYIYIYLVKILLQDFMYIKMDRAEYSSTNPSVLLHPLPGGCSSVYCQNIGWEWKYFILFRMKWQQTSKATKVVKKKQRASQREPSRNFVMKSTDRLCDDITAQTDNIVLLLLFYLYLKKHKIKKSAAIMCCSLVIEMGDSHIYTLFSYMCIFFIHIICIPTTHIYIYIGKYNYYICVSVYNDYNELIVFGARVFPL